MANPILNSFLGRQSLRAGSIVAGVCAILLAIIFLVCMFLNLFTPRTILFDWLSVSIVKVIISFNMFMTIVISTIMIVGVLKRNHYLMLPWVVLGCMLVIGFLLSVIYNTVLNIIAGLLIHALVFFIVGIIIVLIYAYMWCVVYSHFTVLREDSKRGKYNRQPYRR